MRRSVLLTVAALAVAACDRKPLPKTGDLQGEVTALVPKVEEAAGLDFKQPPKVESQSPEQVRTFLMDQFARPAVRKDLDAKIGVWKRLGVVPDSVDVIGLLTRLLTEQVVGFYDPKSKTLYVVEGRQGVERETVIRHELTHALQDQYVNLDSIQNLQGDDDRVEAAQAVFEGHATVMMIGNAARTIAWDKARESIRDARAANPIFGSAPGFLAEGLLFPYLGGAEFVRTVMGDGVSSAQLLQSLPTSTSQVLHRERWGANGNAAEVVRLTAPPGVTIAYQNSFGEFETRLALSELLGDVGRASAAARGQDGDRYAVLSLPAGEGLVWVSVWDTPLDAEEYAEAIAAAMAKRYGAVAQNTQGRREVSGRGRVVTVRTAKVGTRDVTIVEDLPSAARGPVITPSAITIAAR
ncbi:MAG TPA: hypothetical protein VE861_10355 [Gemmatimonadaceae bacterium]|nr:hypothetical protein [Gemmatimonadaceae bacterium]